MNGMIGPDVANFGQKPAPRAAVAPRAGDQAGGVLVRVKYFKFPY